MARECEWGTGCVAWAAQRSHGIGILFPNTYVKPILYIGESAHLYSHELSSR